MTEIVDISAAYERQIRESVKSSRRSARTTTENIPDAARLEASRFGDQAVILNHTLNAASHALTGATTAEATVCRWDAAAGQYRETSRVITVWNHAESTSYPTHTFGAARHINGHWWFFGDCAPMAERGT